MGQADVRLNRPARLGGFTAVTLLACLAFQGAAAREPRSNPSAPEALAQSARHIEADVRFLADDLLEGREVGTRGFDLAALYVATQYRLIGLEPAGEDGSWFQRDGRGSSSSRPNSCRPSTSPPARPRSPHRWCSSGRASMRPSCNTTTSQAWTCGDGSPCCSATRRPAFPWTSGPSTRPRRRSCASSSGERGPAPVEA